MVKFRTSIGLTLLLFTLAMVFAWLGLWQQDRKAEKEALFELYDNAPVLQLEVALDREQRFARVKAFGRYDAVRHILLDNAIFNGRAGVHVLTPFTLADGTSVLVNRGWLALPADRLSLPEVPTDGSPVTINGRLNVLPTDGHRIGEPDVLVTDRWPQLVTYLDPESASKALDMDLANWLVQLDASDVSGFEGREWQAAVMKPQVHGAYALQWFALSIAAIIIWISLGVRSAQEKNP